MNFMCANPSEAAASRERQREGYGNRWHDYQAKATAQWGLCEPKPEGLKVYELPTVGKLGQLHKHLDEDYSE